MDIPVKINIGGKDTYGTMPEEKFQDGGPYTKVSQQEYDNRNGDPNSPPPPDTPTKLVNLAMSPWQSGIQSGLDFSRKVLSTAATVGNEAVARSGEVMGNLAAGVIKANKYNPFSYPTLGAPGMADQFAGQVQSISKGLADTARKANDPISKDSYAPSVANGVGNFAGSVAGQIPALAIGGPILKSLNLGLIPNFLVQSLGNTTIMTQGMEGRLPTAKEAGGYMALDAVLALAVKGLSMAYQSAFNASPTQMKQSLRAYGTTPGANAEEAGLYGTSTQVMNQADSKGYVAFKKLKDLVSSDPKTLSPEIFTGIKEGIAADLAKDLPPTAPRVKEIFKAVADIVDNYTPTEPITQPQLVGIVTDINAQLFKSDKIALTTKQADSLVNIFKSSLKDFMPEGSKQLYTRMSIMKGIQQTMESAIVKKAVLSTMLGGLGGFNYGYNSDLKSTANKVWNGFVGGLIGAVIMNGITNSTLAKTGVNFLGKTLLAPTVLKTGIDTIQNLYK